MVGLPKAKQLFLLGKFTSAEEALKIGLLSEIADDPKLRTLELAHTLAGMPAIAGAQLKLSLERAVFPNMENVLADKVNVAGYCFAQSDAVQAFTDFAARKPNGPKISAV
jgi:crotonobetaine/carnitine-CoA ligase